jgi:hypothetical protein
VKQLGFAWFQAVQKPFALSFHVPAVLPLPDCSSGSRVIFPSGVKIILNFAPEGDTAVNGCPVKKVAFISFGAMGSAAKAAPSPKSVIAIMRPPRSTQKSPLRATQYGSRLSRSRSTASFLKVATGEGYRNSAPSDNANSQTTVAPPRSLSSSLLPRMHVSALGRNESHSPPRVIKTTVQMQLLCQSQWQ